MVRHQGSQQLLVIDHSRLFLPVPPRTTTRREASQQHRLFSSPVEQVLVSAPASQSFEAGKGLDEPCHCMVVLTKEPPQRGQTRRMLLAQLPKPVHDGAESRPLVVVHVLPTTSLVASGAQAQAPFEAILEFYSVHPLVGASRRMRRSVSQPRARDRLFLVFAESLVLRHRQIWLWWPSTAPHSCIEAVAERDVIDEVLRLATLARHLIVPAQ